MATAIYNPAADIKALGVSNKASATLDLTTARNKSLDTLATSKKEIEPAYLKQRNTVDTNSQVAARNFAEFMAQRGQNNAAGMSGSLAQSNISNNALRQGNLGALATGEALAYTTNAKQVADVNTAYNTGVASSNAKIDATTLQSLITGQQNYNASTIAQENTNRQFNATQTQQALDNAYRNAALARSSSGGSGGSGGSSRSGSSSSSKASTKANTLYNNQVQSIDDELNKASNSIYTNIANLQDVINKNGSNSAIGKYAASQKSQLEKQKTVVSSDSLMQRIGKVLMR